MSVDNYSDDDLAKRYMNLGDRMAWNDRCKNCKMPTLLHDGPCTRQQEANTFESNKILEERDKFNNSMRNMIRDVAEQERTKEVGTGQNDLLKVLIDMAKAMRETGGKAAKIVKPKKVPVWTQKMELKDL